ncbi:MAG: ABC transporter ATP-binding protein [Bacilli bacterium]
MLKIENLRMEFGNLVAVDDLSFQLDTGEILGLLGANGAGKTTTFRIILGILKQTSGEVQYNGEHIDLNKSSEIGFLVEERALLTKYTVYQQLKFFADLKGMNKNKVDEKIDYWLKHFSLSDKKNSKIKQLSKGNQQKIQFISAIIHEPKLIILDEPFSGLDPFNINLFKKTILELKEKGCCIIFSSHRLDHVEFFCENIIVLVEGKAVLRGNIIDLKKESGINKVKIISEIPIVELKKLEYVSSVEEVGDFKEVYLSNIDNLNSLFDVIKKYSCSHFALELPSLEEVFIKKVGIKYEA